MRTNLHPNFFVGLFSFLLFLVGIAMKVNTYREGDYLLIASGVVGGIHWIWAIIDVFSHQNFKSQSKVFWIILVVAIPPIGGILYYLMSKTMRM